MEAMMSSKQERKDLIWGILVAVVALFNMIVYSLPYATDMILDFEWHSNVFVVFLLPIIADIMLLISGILMMMHRRAKSFFVISIIFAVICVVLIIIYPLFSMPLFIAEKIDHTIDIAKPTIINSYNALWIASLILRGCTTALVVEGLVLAIIGKIETEKEVQPAKKDYDNPDI